MNGSYGVIRFIPDIARNEPINIGIVAWAGDDLVVSVPEHAVKRVIAVHPTYPPYGLEGLETHIRRQVQSVQQDVRANPLLAVDHFTRLIGLPLVLSPPMFLFIEEAGPSVRDQLQEHVRQLIDRLVRTPHHPRKTAESAKTRLAAYLKPMVDREWLIPDYELVGGKSSRTRKIAFFANHGSNVPLDVFEARSNLSREGLLDRADYYVAKIQDVIAASDQAHQKLNHYMLYLPADQREDIAAAAYDISNYIERSTDVRVVKAAEVAGTRMLSLYNASQG